ncbi:hypothetical protein BEP19_08545 [Ammoniphilus oxalaticus]|uniref:Sporulation protein n=1 Tax=Ammoniphilus oxalaticus TaxID=66863 RepID=A0A419SKC1_9BACL|nr:hypothetical protein [Ammoniphilus oxalaticus]RKD24427.1 hypothetical protein BEP19_08545 [Ammoniphilus oxalaticus]
MRIALVSILALSLLAGCNSGPTRDGIEVKQHKREINSDRYIAKEFNHRRPYTFKEQNQTQHPELDRRISTEATRVYNVQKAIVLRQGKDIIIGLTTKADPWQPHHETVELTRDRLLSKEPDLYNYNLYFTTNDLLQKQMIRARRSVEQGATINTTQPYEPHFTRILEQVKEQPSR